MLPPGDRDVFKLSITVHGDDIDDRDHVNNIVYLRWVQEASAGHWKQIASPTLLMQCMWVVLRHEIDYLSSAVLGDMIEAITWVDQPEGVRQQRHVCILRTADQSVLAYAKSTWCLLNPTTGKPKRISEEIISLFGLKKGK